VETPAPVPAFAYEPEQTAAEAAAVAESAAVPDEPARPKIDCENTKVDEESRDWEDFVYCMRNNVCSVGAGAEQPTNVMCYRRAVYDNAILTCRDLGYDKEKLDTFSCHYWNKIIPAEKEEFCKNRGGTWSGGKCQVSIKFVSTDKKCKRTSSVTKIIDENPRQFQCSYMSFNLPPCYEENPNKDALEMQKKMAGFKIGMGVLTAGVSAISAFTSHTKTTTNDGKTTEVKCGGSGTDCPGRGLMTAAAAIQGGAQGITDGAIDIMKANALMGNEGPVYQGGLCEIPIGRDPDGKLDVDKIREGGTVILGW
jgi:hypothetical protein